MADKKTPPTILALFTTQAAAEAAVSALAEAGFEPDQMGFMAPADAESPKYPKTAAAGVAGGSVLGGAAGAILGAASIGAIPGIGPVLVAGSLIPIGIGAMTGASTGGTVGGLLGAASGGDEGLYYVQEVRSGRSLVAVRTDRPEDARSVLQGAGAMEVADVGRSETAARIIGESRDAEPD